MKRDVKIREMSRRFYSTIQHKQDILHERQRRCSLAFNYAIKRAECLREYEKHLSLFLDESMCKRLTDANNRRSLLQQPTFAEEHNYAAKVLTQIAEEKYKCELTSKRYFMDIRLYLARCRRMQKLDNVALKAIEMGSPLRRTLHLQDAMHINKLVDDQ
jgi:hypothetical protein